ncbi:hypothetical protein PC117_g16774 [Phytophthora cactorum]|uniref:Uncharacterized protein n=1 Tax=Phytophthora cactorum TaxID=29920 RepID=A0A8T1CE12_9STRA|nr:hypothetical protein PC117_g16774 [Phytophthora cactorum]
MPSSKQLLQDKVRLASAGATYDGLPSQRSFHKRPTGCAATDPSLAGSLDPWLPRSPDFRRSGHRSLASRRHHRDDHPSNGSGSLFRHFYQPPEWLFTHRDPTPPATEWRDDLIDVDHMRVSEDAAPGDVLATPVDPLTFEDGGWFAHLVRIYLTYEDEDRHAHWDSTHAFPISIAKRRQSRYLSGFYTNRKQRRSRAGPRWKVFLQ